MAHEKDKNYGWHEIIRIASPGFLVSSKHGVCHYETSDCKPLAPGYYLALWPSGGDYSSYGREVKYFGPYATKAEVQLLETSAKVLNIIEGTGLTSYPKLRIRNSEFSIAR